MLNFEEIALNHVGKWAAQAGRLASLLYEQVQDCEPGIGSPLDDLIELGYCDEDGKWKDDYE